MSDKIHLYLREAREKRGISSRKMSREMGMDNAAYSRTETGARRLSASELVCAADILGMSVDDLVHRRDGAQVEAWRLTQKCAVAAVDAVSALASQLGVLEELDHETVNRLIGKLAPTVLVHPGRAAQVREALSLIVGSVPVVEARPGVLEFVDSLLDP